MAPRRSLRASTKADASKTAVPPQTSRRGSTPEQPIAPTVSSFEIPSTSGKLIKCEQYSPRGGQHAAVQGKKTSSSDAEVAPALVFTHGAGGGLSNPATSCFAIGAAATTPTLVFEGGPNLVARTKRFQAVLHHVLDSRTQEENGSGVPALGGRSLGARAAVQTANARNTDDTSNAYSPLEALILVSYPLTGPKGDMRDEILCSIHSNVDVLFISGDRDSMCDLEQLDGVRKRMHAQTWLAVVQGADHGMSVKPSSAVETRRKATGALAARWLASRDRERTECAITDADIVQWMAPTTQSTQEEKGEGMKRKASGKADGAKTAKKQR